MVFSHGLFARSFPMVLGISLWHGLWPATRTHLFEYSRQLGPYYRIRKTINDEKIKTIRDDDKKTLRKDYS